MHGRVDPANEDALTSAVLDHYPERKAMNDKIAAMSLDELYETFPRISPEGIEAAQAAEEKAGRSRK